MRSRRRWQPQPPTPRPAAAAKTRPRIARAPRLGQFYPWVGQFQVRPRSHFVILLCAACQALRRTFSSWDRPGALCACRSCNHSCAFCAMRGFLNPRRPLQFETGTQSSNWGDPRIGGSANSACDQSRSQRFASSEAPFGVAAALWGAAAGWCAGRAASSQTWAHRFCDCEMSEAMNALEAHSLWQPRLLGNKGSGQG